MPENRNILIVDDDVDHLGLIERYTDFYGAPYTSAKDAFRAMDILKSTEISVVVTDLVMPGMDGIELLRHIKAEYPHINVIVMTGYSKEYSYTQVIKEGATDFIAKPFKRDEYAAKLDRAFRERQLLMELTEAKERAETANSIKTVFLNTIGHELRTPMNGILGFAGLLQEMDLDPESAEYLKMLSSSADRLMRMIDQILDFSSLESGEGDLAYDVFMLENLFDEILPDFRRKAESKGLHFDFQIDELIVNTRFAGYPSTLMQILHNLLDNAIKFTDHGSIQVQVMQTRKLTDRDIELEFAIQDTGCGINPAKQREIFDPFTQADEYLTRRHDGAGLGLAICARLIKLVGGKLWVDSEVDKGSVFYFTLNVATAQ